MKGKKRNPKIMKGKQEVIQRYLKSTKEGVPSDLHHGLAHLDTRMAEHCWNIIALAQIGMVFQGLGASVLDWTVWPCSVQMLSARAWNKKNAGRFSKSSFLESAWQPWQSTTLTIFKPPGRVRPPEYLFGP